MDKRGIEERQWLWIFYFVIIVFVSISAIVFVNNAVDKTRLNQDYFSRDLALLLDAVYAGDGELEIIYPLAESKFDFFIGDVDGEFKVVVGENLDDQGKGIGARSYPYHARDSFGLFVKPENFLITKKEGVVTIDVILDDLFSGFFAGGEFGGAGATRGFENE